MNFQHEIESFLKALKNTTFSKITRRKVLVKMIASKKIRAKSKTSSRERITKLVTNDSTMTKEVYPSAPILETWSFPKLENKSGIISIMDKTGKCVYKQAFSMKEVITWDGKSSEDTLLNVGLYGYIIEYFDGTVEQGTITLSY